MQRLPIKTHSLDFTFSCITSWHRLPQYDSGPALKSVQKNTTLSHLSHLQLATMTHRPQYWGRWVYTLSCHREKEEILWLPLFQLSMSQQEYPAQVSTVKNDQYWDFTREHLSMAATHPDLSMCPVRKSVYVATFSLDFIYFNVQRIWKKAEETLILMGWRDKNLKLDLNFKKTIP